MSRHSEIIASLYHFSSRAYQSTVNCGFIYDLYVAEGRILIIAYELIMRVTTFLPFVWICLVSRVIMTFLWLRSVY